MTVEESTLRSKVLKGFFWFSTGTFVGQFISWISTIFVIRLLLPEDYGLMAMASSVIALLATLSELGVSASIIQAKQIQEKELRQIFGFVLLSSLAGCALCYLVAPFVAAFYQEPQLTVLIRVMNFNFLLMAMYIVPQALYIREMNFRTKAKIDVSAQIGSSLLTLFLALAGMGVWSLIVGQISLHAIKAIGFTWARASWWRPVFDFQGAGNSIRYGLVVTFSSLFYFLFSIVDTIIIGKLLGGSLLGTYAVALNLASIPAEKVMPIITMVSFTSYSRIQDEGERIKKNILRTTCVIAYTGFPLFFGMVGVAPEAIPLLLGSKWTVIIVPFQLLCVILPLKAISTILPPAVFAVGRPKVNLTNMIVACMVMAISFLVGVKAGLLGICAAWVITYPCVFLVTSVRCLRVLDISLRDFLSELKLPFFAGTLMLVSLILLKRLTGSLQPLPALMALIAFGIAFYAGFVRIFDKDVYSRLMDLYRK